MTTTYFARAALWIAMLAFLCIIFLGTAAAEQSESTTILEVTEKGDDNNVCQRSASTTIPASCPINCFRADPVCSVDGITYWCGCAEAACHGANVAKLGVCEVGNGGSGSLHGQALLLVHIVWLFLVGFSLLFGLF